MKKKESKAQATIFIILALAIVIILFLLLTGRGNLDVIFGPTSPVQEIKDCTQEATEEALDILMLQGGSISPELYYLYQGNKVEYLCYSDGNYENCVMQKPLLKQSIEQEIQNYISPKVKSCVNAVVSDLQGKGYDVSMKSPEISVSLIRNNVLVDVEADLKITKDGTESYKSIKTDMPFKLYNMVMIASSISNWEAVYGDSETMNYMMYYPSLKVEKKKQGEGTTIYILTDPRGSDNKFMFASRSLVLPAGLTGQ